MKIHLENSEDHIIEVSFCFIVISQSVAEI